MVGSLQYFFVLLGQVLDHQTHRTQYRHGTRRILIQIVPNAGFQHAHFHGVFLLGHTDTLTKLANGRRGIATTTQTGDGRHARVIPPFNVTVGHQLVKLALRHNRVFQVESRELVLARMTFDADVVQHPVVQTTVILKLQGTQRMADAFNRIRNTVGKVIHRVDAPLVTGLMMMDETHPVQHGITQHHKGRCHVDFSPQTGGAFRKLTIAHAGKQAQVFFNRPIPVGAAATR